MYRLLKDDIIVRFVKDQVWRIHSDVFSPCIDGIWHAFETFWSFFIYEKLNFRNGRKLTENEYRWLSTAELNSLYISNYLSDWYTDEKIFGSRENSSESIHSEIVKYISYFVIQI